MLCQAKSEWSPFNNKLRADSPDAQDSSGLYPIIGSAVISTSLSKHWEATVELIQANTNDRLLNIQIFTELLRRIRSLCTERFINHLAIFDIDDESQNWYRDFFRLAGFNRCRCHISAGMTLQLGTWNCLASREAFQWELLTVYERVRIWLAEGRCTKALLDSVASGEAVEVERKHFQDLLAQLKNENHSEFTRMGMELTRRCQVRSQNSRQNCVRTSAVSKGRSWKPRTKFLPFGKYWYSQRTSMKVMDRSGLGVVKRRRWSCNTRGKCLQRTLRSYNRPDWLL